MRRPLLIALTVLLTFGVPAHAQPAPERTLVDLTVFVEPPTRQGLCMGMGSGQVTVTVRRAAEAIEGRPARFTLTGFMADPDAQIEAPISSQDVTITTHLSGSDRYC